MLVVSILGGPLGGVEVIGARVRVLLRSESCDDGQEEGSSGHRRRDVCLGGAIFSERRACHSLISQSSQSSILHSRPVRPRAQILSAFVGTTFGSLSAHPSPARGSCPSASAHWAPRARSACLQSRTGSRSHRGPGCCWGRAPQAA